MSEKKFNSRVINKHDTEENWNKSSFIPKQGEVIVYDIDSTYNYERIKIGDGENNVNDLPFVAVQSDYSTNDKLNPSYIKNRTHWSEGAIVVSWDGNISGLTASSDNTAYKVSDLKPSASEIIGGQLTFSNGTTETITSDMVENLGYILSVYYGTVYINTSSGSAYDASTNITLPKPGIYIQKNSNNQLVSFSYGDETIHQLAEKYIPETIARMTEVDKKLNKAGDTMTGSLDMGNNNINNVNHIATSVIEATTSAGIGGVHIDVSSSGVADGESYITFLGAASNEPVRVKGVAAPTENNAAANKEYVDAKVAGIVNSAPETLDTLNELAAALGNDPNFAATVATQIGTKVDKVDGKGLSTNDYTTTEKTKLTGIEEGANKTIVDSALDASSTNPVQNNVVNTAIEAVKKDLKDNYLSDTGDVMYGALSFSANGKIVLGSAMYGTSLPSSGTTGQIFFLKV